MIVPRNNLLWWVALGALPAVLIGVLLPGAARPCLGLAALIGALALLDAALSHGRLAGLRVRLPGAARLTQGRPGAIELEFENDAKCPLKLNVGLPFPEVIESAEEALTVSLPSGAALSHARWPVRPLRRGRYVLDKVYIERPSPLGLWLVRAALPLQGELRVYPDLMPECRAMASLFLPRGGAGVRARRQVGKGREFEKLREYIPGDALGDIHWKATAKRGRPITKLFQIERTQEVYLIVDTSRLSARELRIADCGLRINGNGIDTEHEHEARARNNGGFNPSAIRNPQSAITTILDRYLTAALVTCQAAERQGDLFGMITFSDKVHSFIPARSGRAHYSVCRDAIHALEPRLVTPDFDELMTTLRLKLRKRALLVFLTNLDDPTLAEAFQQRLDLVCRHHLVIAAMLAPPEARELFDTTDAQSEADLYRRLGGHMLWQDLRRLERELARRGVRFSTLSHAALVPELVSQYLEIKQRQLL
jgi:uncharacterized protein (DUF58 family)